MQRNEEFVTELYNLMFPFSGAAYGLPRGTSLQDAVSRIRSQLNSLCTPNMKYAVVLIMAALKMEPTERESANDLCQRLRERLSEAVGEHQQVTPLPSLPSVSRLSIHSPEPVRRERNPPGSPTRHSTGLHPVPLAGLPSVPSSNRQTLPPLPSPTRQLTLPTLPTLPPAAAPLYSPESPKTSPTFQRVGTIDPQEQLILRMIDAQKRGKVLDVSRIQVVPNAIPRNIKMVNHPGPGSRKRIIQGLPFVSDNYKNYEIIMTMLGPGYKGYANEYRRLDAEADKLKEIERK